jgi:hypothetical protein
MNITYKKLPLTRMAYKFFGIIYLAKETVLTWLKEKKIIIYIDFV